MARVAFIYCIKSFLLNVETGWCVPCWKTFISILCLCFWLLLMFKPEWKIREKAKHPNQLLAVFRHALVIEIKVNLMAVLSKIQPCLSSQISLLGCTFVWSIISHFYFRGHVCAAPYTELQNYWSKSLQRNMRKHLLWNCNFLDESLCSCGSKSAAFLLQQNTCV